MPTPLRPQQYRLQWPLTASQVEGIDSMLETLFKEQRRLADLLATGPATPVVSGGGSAASLFSILGFPGLDGEEGLMGPPGAAGAQGASGQVSGLNVASIPMNSSDITGLNSAAVTIVAAQGANTLIVPVAWGFLGNKDTGSWTSNNFTLRHTGLTTDVLAQLPANLNNSGAGDMANVASGSTIIGYSSLGTTRFNKALLVGEAGTFTAPSPPNTVTGKVYVLYFVMSF